MLPRGMLWAFFLLVPAVQCVEVAPSTRVAGIGVGLFLVIFFGVLALCCCLVGSNSNNPSCVAALSLTRPACERFSRLPVTPAVVY